MKARHLITAAAAALFMAGTASAQDLVIRIDDIGSSHSANLACIDTYRNGIAQSVEIMTVCPWFMEAVGMLKENPGLDVGVHLVLSSEWEGIKWGPLTDCPSLVDPDGYFWPKVSPAKSMPGKSLVENGYDLAEIEAEFRAQIEMAMKYIPNVTHLSGHMGSEAFSQEVSDLILKLSAEYGLPSMDHRGSEQQYGYRFVSYDGPRRTLKEKVESLSKTIMAMEPGKRYMFLDHPAYDDSEMQGVFHQGYENVGSDRQGVTDMLKSRKLRKLIEKKGIRLISFAELANN